MDIAHAVRILMWCAISGHFSGFWAARSFWAWA